MLPPAGRAEMPAVHESESTGPVDGEPEPGG